MASEQDPSKLQHLPSETTAFSQRQSSSQLIIFTAYEPGQRLDMAVAARAANLSRSQAQRLIKAERVLVNNRPSKAAYRLAPGDEVTVSVPPNESLVVVAEDIPLQVLYEDDDLIAINKEAGMVVHPATSHQRGTLVNAALNRWPQLVSVGEPQRSGVVHRLDKDTSGVILLAKTDTTLAHLQEQFKQRRVEKRYLALVEGIPESSEGLIDAPVGRDPRHRKRLAVVREGRQAITRYQLLQAYEEHVLLELLPQTGRTHQLRIHLAWLGHPVVGDKVYGYRKQRIKLERHWLHAAALTVYSPSNDDLLNFEAPIPSELQNVLDSLA